MSPWLTYLIGLVTLPVLALIFLVQDDARKTGRWWGCDRHGWSSGPMGTTPRWKAWARWRLHAVRYHRHGVRWDNA